MANPYPANFEGLDGSQRLTGQVDFTDAANQPGGGGSSVLQSATVHVSSAQILALHDTPVTLVAAQGSGTAAVPLFIVASSSAGTPYDRSAAGNLRLLGLLDPGALSDVSNAISTAATTAFEDYSSILGGDFNDTTAADNKALTMTYGTDNPTAGDTTLFVVTFYVVAALV